MAVTWSLRRASGTILPLDTAQGADVERRLVNLGVSTALVTLPREQLIATPSLLPNERVSILRDPGSGAVRWFHGRVTYLDNAASGSSERLVVTVSDPWWELDQLIYTAQATFVDDPDQLPLPYNPPINAEQSNANLLALADLAQYVRSSQRTSVILTSADAGTRINTQDWIIALLDYAIDNGAPLLRGTIGTGLDVPREQVSDQTIGELIRRALRWTPDMSGWFDYATTPPTLHITQRRSKSVSSLSLSGNNISEVSLTPRHDLIVRGVTVNYLRRNQRPNLEFYSLSKDVAGAALPGLQTLSLSIELAGSSASVSNGQLVFTPAEAAPAGVAARIYDALNDLHYAGQIILHAQECPDGNPLGAIVKIIDGNPAWRTMGAVVQTATDHVFAGRTELEVGPPEHLAPQDFVELARMTRQNLPQIVLKIIGSDDGSVINPSPTPDTPVPSPTVVGGPAPDGSGGHEDHSLSYYLVAGGGETYAGSSDTGKVYVGSTPPVPDPPGDPEAPLISHTASDVSRTFNGGGSRGVDGGGPFTIQAATLDYTIMTFDFRSLPSGVSKIVLVGSRTISQASGPTTVTEDCYQDITSFRGQIARIKADPVGGEVRQTTSDAKVRTEVVGYDTIRLIFGTVL